MLHPFNVSIKWTHNENYLEPFLNGFSFMINHVNMSENGPDICNQVMSFISLNFMSKFSC